MYEPEKEKLFIYGFWKAIRVSRKELNAIYLGPKVWTIDNIFWLVVKQDLLYTTVVAKTATVNKNNFSQNIFSCFVKIKMFNRNVLFW